MRTTTPANSIATTTIPLIGLDSKEVIVRENGTIFWENGSFIAGINGIFDAESVEDAIVVHHGSGVYDFRSVMR